MGPMVIMNQNQDGSEPLWLLMGGLDSVPGSVMVRQTSHTARF